MFGAQRVKREETSAEPGAEPSSVVVPRWPGPWGGALARAPTHTQAHAHEHTEYLGSGQHVCVAPSDQRGQRQPQPVACHLFRCDTLHR